jgi:hypothetical protein
MMKNASIVQWRKGYTKLQETENHTAERLINRTIRQANSLYKTKYLPWPIHLRRFSMKVSGLRKRLTGRKYSIFRGWESVWFIVYGMEWTKNGEI